MSRLRSLVARLALGAAAVFAVAACSERLVTPGDCPELCPGGQLPIFDTTLYALVGQDSSFVGYVERGLGTAILVANGLDGATDHGVVRFLPRADSILVSDTNRAYVIDSVALQLGVILRDSSVKNLRFRLYKLPATFDEDVTYDQVSGALTPGALIDSVTVPDTIVQGIRRIVLKGDQLARIALADEDDGVLRMGVELAADGVTGARVGALAAGSFTPLFITYVTADVADTALQKQAITRGTDLTTWVSNQPDPVPDAGTLVVGGAPSYRTLLRFPWGAKLEDSITIVRARLELLPVGTVPGLPSDTASLQARAIVADLGAKSPLLQGLTLSTNVPAGAPDTLALDVGTLVGQWQGTNPRPPAVFLSLSPEAASFTTLRIASSSDPARVARLRIAYVLRFPFETP